VSPQYFVSVDTAVKLRLCIVLYTVLSSDRECSLCCVRAGLVKPKTYDWKDSNLALFGSDTEKQVKSKTQFV